MKKLTSLIVSGDKSSQTDEWWTVFWSICNAWFLIEINDQLVNSFCCINY